MLKFLSLITLLSSSSCLLATNPKNATVDLSRVIKVSHGAISNQDARNKRLNELNNSKRALTLKEQQAILEELIKKLKTKNLPKKSRERILIETRAARLAYEEIKAKWNSWHPNEIRKINEEFINRSEVTLNKLTEISQQVGESLGYDWVLDPNGYTNSQMPVLVYIRDSTDITEEVIKVINKNTLQVEPAEPEETSNTPKKARHLWNSL